MSTTNQTQGESWQRILSPAELSLVETISASLRLTVQETQQVATAARDLTMWRELPLEQWWETNRPRFEAAPSRETKKKLLNELREKLDLLRRGAKSYPEHPLGGPPRGARKIEARHSDRKVFGRCPVYSEKTVCCGLYTLDAVTGCAFSCSYCTIQTFYPEVAEVDAELANKLGALTFDTDRYYHVGTGQASDSLVWGNRNGVLEALGDFARKNPNVLLELKTKSDRVDPLLELEMPPNVVVSWSLNPDEVIRNEEHGTASLQRRIQAARRVVDAGRYVAFHFHPMVHYSGWEAGYGDLAAQVINEIHRDHVAFTSMGTMTFIRPVMQEIRRRGGETKVLQMELEKDPHGKLTYAIETKLKLYRHLYGALAPWHDNVYFYLCMEPDTVWQQLWGWAYARNELFEQDFGRHCADKGLLSLG